MAFDLKVNNLTGVSVITQPGGVVATPANFITLYDYAKQYQPELIPELHYQNGKGSITGLLNMIAGEKTYASDMVQHAEMQRLHNKLKNVAVAGNTFTSPINHQLRPNMIVKISDGVKEVTAYVSAIVSDTVFTALNTKVGAYGFAGNVDIVVDFTNTWNKGTGTFEKGRTWNPIYRQNYSQIIKEVYEVNESDMAHTIWIDTPDGPRWCNVEIERTNTLFDNIVELTHFFGERLEAGSPAALAGAPLGMKGIIQEVESYGNLSTDYIQTVAALRDIALRVKEQGVDAKEYVFFCNHTQMNHFNDICSTVSPADVNAGNYGFFENKEGMELFMDFSSIKVSGITFYFKPWDLLDDPTLMATGLFNTTGLCFFGMPMGKMKTQNESGETENKPYLSFMYRSKGNVNRKRKAKIFGLGGTQISEDVMRLELLSETTNQVVGANAFFVGRKTA
jgi:hypothetical protein